MNFGRRITLYVLLYITLCSAAFAQVVHIPDSNLRTAVSNALNLPADALITQEELAQVTGLYASNSTGAITNLTGLEHAINLMWLSISGHEITDITPIANLAKLERLFMWHNPISDINPLTNLTNLQVLKAAQCGISDISALRSLSNLTELHLGSNNIADIQPLANLTQLTALYLASNNISDVKPLANLTRLTILEIQNNKIADHSPLDALPLVHSEYDQSCEMPPLPLVPRLENRSRPSVLAAWGGLSRSPVLNQPHLSGIEQITQHDLYFNVPMFRQRLFDTGNGWEVRGNLEIGEQLRDDYLALNPNMVFLVEIRMRTEWIDDYPEDWPHWLRDAEGNIPVLEPGSPTALIDFTHPDTQERIIQKAIAVSKCGLYDGIFFDHWNEDGSVLVDHQMEGYVGNEAEQRARDIILERIRAETRPNFLIMGNTNDRIIPRTAPHINGGYMETGMPGSSSGVRLEKQLARIESSLL